MSSVCASVARLTRSIAVVVLALLLSVSPALARGGIPAVAADGAEFAAALKLPPGTDIVSKDTAPDQETYSAFAGGDLRARLEKAGVRRVFVGGLATDYCVLNTVLDARKAGLEVLVLEGAVRAVDVQPGDGARALERMKQAGAQLIPDRPAR